MNEAELLFTEILQCDRLSLYFNRNSNLDARQFKMISAVLKKRIKGQPLQYILTKTEFMGLGFKINPDVFIPRAETEILVEQVLKKTVKLSNCQTVKASKIQSVKVNILEIGTGSGCIAVSLAKFLPSAQIVATDISELALCVARENARLNSVDDRITFLKSDLFESPKIRDMRHFVAAQCPSAKRDERALRAEGYTICVSNPPYISTSEISHLQAEIICEPRLAWDGGQDGLDFYRRIIKECSPYLKEGGYLIMEIGFKQRESIEAIAKSGKEFKLKEVIRDYHNIERVMVFEKARGEARWINLSLRAGKA